VKVMASKQVTVRYSVLIVSLCEPSPPASDIVPTLGKASYRA